MWTFGESSMQKREDGQRKLALENIVSAEEQQGVKGQSQPHLPSRSYALFKHDCHVTCLSLSPALILYTVFSL